MVSVTGRMSKEVAMSRTVSRTHELSEKMDEIVRRMNRGELTAEDVVRQLFPMAMQSFVEASQECEQISQSLDEIEGICWKPGHDKVFV